ncbi:dolichyl-diphosphooligosaccharide--protein glycosyltransferase subunit 2 [Aristolochia californica]|uniref:dolichyl-diphosphooligosaccharide--protein glycosyltransferase subunit 2 n=1 Tax=Aristolochia californica TaxID=171875 RepID=UPI0035E226DC
MARNLGLLVLFVCLTVCKAAIFQPVSNAHRSAALELFAPIDGSFGSLEETYEVLRTLQVLCVEKSADISPGTCPVVVETLGSSSSSAKDYFNALKVNSMLNCNVDDKIFEAITSKLQAVLKDATLLSDFYHSIGSLVLIKDQGSKADVLLEDADGIFHAIKALSQSDGKWKYDSSGAESSAYASGVALETLAGILKIAGAEVDQSVIGIVKNDIVKLFDSIESYDDGALYFDEKLVDAKEHQGPLSTTSSVVRGFTSFAAVISGRLNVPGDKILGLANFFLSMGVPGNIKDLYYQIDSLACLENNRVFVPLVLSLPSSVLSLTSQDQLKVMVNTVLGSDAPPLTVKLVQVISSISKDSPAVLNQDLNFDADAKTHSLDLVSKGIDVGKYTLVFEVLFHDPEHKKAYVTGERTKAPIYITGLIRIDKAEIAVLDSDIGRVETVKKLDLSGESSVSLSANHLQKLRLSFRLATPLGHPFNPHQVYLKLRHIESKVQHIYIVGNSGKKFEIVLDFLGLVDKLFYLSGRYGIELTVGDATMENSFLHALGHVDLDLPEAPEKAPRPPAQPVDLYSKFGPKAEISHIFRAPEKRPPQQLSVGFLVLTLLPFAGFLIGLIRLGVNFKNFPTSALPATFAILFHCGLAAVLLLYVLFWLKLDLFTTLKALGFLGVFLVFVGHRTLSHLASTSSKQKAA